MPPPPAQIGLIYVNVMPMRTQSYSMPAKAKYCTLVKNNDSDNNRKPQLRMNNGQLILYVEKCIHLSNILSSTSREHAMITSSITDFNIKTNNLLSEFSFSESTTLSRLFSSYCMNVYGSSLWRYSNLRNIELFLCFMTKSYWEIMENTIQNSK